MIRRLQDASLRKRLEDEINHGIPGSNWYNHYTAAGGWEGMLLVSLSNPRYKQFQGKRMNEVIETLKRPGIDVLFELLINNKPIAVGDAVKVGENFGLKINQIGDVKEVIRSMGR